ncbi:MAG: hypothetical protein COA73_00575 [Candidatus Hydrogenedentota bacterium]|nr:MAG: hypothetical protein COA73_00575 [Candidatus Hydrogenedentota bacterium]
MGCTHGYSYSFPFGNVEVLVYSGATDGEVAEEDIEAALPRFFIHSRGRLCHNWILGVLPYGI